MKTHHHVYIMYTKFGIQFRLRIVDSFVDSFLLLFWPPKVGGHNTEYNLFILFIVSVCCIQNFLRMLYSLYNTPIDFFVSL